MATSAQDAPKLRRVSIKRGHSTPPTATRWDVLSRRGQGPREPTREDEAVTSSEGSVIRLPVFPDYPADSVWKDTRMVDLDSLPLSDTVVTALRGWASEW